MLSWARFEVSGCADFANDLSAAQSIFSRTPLYQSLGSFSAFLLFMIPALRDLRIFAFAAARAPCASELHASKPTCS